MLCSSASYRSCFDVSMTLHEDATKKTKSMPSRNGNLELVIIGFETLIILQAIVSVVAALRDAVNHVSELLVLVTLVTLVTLLVIFLVRVCDVCNTTKTDPC